MSDLDGQDAFDRLLETALDSRVDVRLARDERDVALQAQRAADKLAAQRLDRIDELEREKKIALPKLSALWIAADQLRAAAASGTAMRAELDTLNTALAEAGHYCDQLPF